MTIGKDISKARNKQFLTLDIDGNISVIKGKTRDDAIDKVIDNPEQVNVSHELTEERKKRIKRLID